MPSSRRSGRGAGGRSLRSSGAVSADPGAIQAGHRRRQHLYDVLREVTVVVDEPSAGTSGQSIASFTGGTWRRGSWLGVSGPFGRLTFDDSSLVISGLDALLHVQRAEVRCIRLRRGLLGHVVRDHQRHARSVHQRQVGSLHRPPVIMAPCPRRTRPLPLHRTGPPSTSATSRTRSAPATFARSTVPRSRD